MQLESLEGRRLFAATVTEGYPGLYEVHGTADDDVIEISVNQDAGTFTLDGATYADVSYIYVHGYDGNDFISVTSEDGSGSIGASISADGGSDTVLLNFDGAIWGGDGKDIIYLSDATRGQVYGEDGSDEIYLSGTSADAYVDGGCGNDYIDATGNYAGATLHGGNGNDEIHGSAYDDQMHGDAGNDTLYGEDGNDVFYVRDGDHDEIHGGAGTDVAYSDLNDDGMADVEYLLMS
jgi:Ca2+-binding RTX toxin-like protein